MQAIGLASEPQFILTSPRKQPTLQFRGGNLEPELETSHYVFEFDFLLPPADNNSFAILAPSPEREIFCAMNHMGASDRPKLVIIWSAP